MRIIAIICTTVIFVAALGAFQLSRAAYESAPYEVERKEGDFEIRVYPPPDPRLGADGD